MTFKVLKYKEAQMREIEMMNNIEKHKLNIPSRVLTNFQGRRWVDDTWCVTSGYTGYSSSGCLLCLYLPEVLGTKIHRNAGFMSLNEDEARQKQTNRQYVGLNSCLHRWVPALLPSYQFHSDGDGGIEWKQYIKFFSELPMFENLSRESECIWTPASSLWFSLAVVFLGSSWSLSEIRFQKIKFCGNLEFYNQRCCILHNCFVNWKP